MKTSITEYSPPRIEIIGVGVERGFANSMGPTGTIDEWGDGGTEPVDVY